MRVNSLIYQVPGFKSAFFLARFFHFRPFYGEADFESVPTNERPGANLLRIGVRRISVVETGVGCPYIKYKVFISESKGDKVELRGEKSGVRGFA